MTKLEDLLSDPIELTKVLQSRHDAGPAVIALLEMKQPPKPKRGAKAGHPGWGGRPRGVTRPCGWCGVELTAAQDRAHWTECPKRPKQYQISPI